VPIALYPQEDPWYSFLLEAEDHNATGRNRRFEKSNDIGNQTRDLTACGIVPHPTTPPRAPGVTKHARKIFGTHNKQENEKRNNWKRIKKRAVRKEGKEEGETRVGRTVVCMVLTGERGVVLMMEINACPRKQDRQQNTAASRVLRICTTCNLTLRIIWYSTLQRLRTFVQNTGGR
jgi:hypothetical protein